MLAQIIEQKRKEVKTLTARPKQNVEKVSFYDSLKNPNRSLAVIAEIKKASPSKGVIRDRFDPLEIAAQYEAVNVDAISVLTDETFFQGCHHDLSMVKQVTNVPILRKDFIIDPKQITESVEIGADAILLIAEVLEDKQLYQLYNEAYNHGLDVLVEVHSLTRLERLLQTFVPKIVGVNNRNLDTFETSLQTTVNLAKYIPKESLFVSESGIRTFDCIETIVNSGANAILVGETFMKEKNVKAAVTKLFKEHVV